MAVKTHENPIFRFRRISRAVEICRKLWQVTRSWLCVFWATRTQCFLGYLLVRHLWFCAGLRKCKTELLLKLNRSLVKHNSVTHTHTHTHTHKTSLPKTSLSQETAQQKNHLQNQVWLAFLGRTAESVAACVNHCCCCCCHHHCVHLFPNLTDNTAAQDAQNWSRFNSRCRRRKWPDQKWIWVKSTKTSGLQSLD